jgi:CHAT domain-containing protein
LPQAPPAQVQAATQVINSPDSVDLRLAALRYAFSARRETSDAQREVLDISLLIPGREPIGRRLSITREAFKKLLAYAYRELYAGLASSVPADSPTPSRLVPLGSAQQNFSREPDNLYRILIAPVIQDLQDAGITTLLISLDDGLRSVPFASLHDGKHYLGEKFSFSIVPSLLLSPLQLPSQATPSKRSETIAFGADRFPDAAPLPLVPGEIKGVVQVADAAAYEGAEFSQARLQQSFADPEIRQLHLASHAVFGRTGAADSYILTGNGKLLFRDLNQFDRPSRLNSLELVFLSACRTAVGDQASELGFSGLALQVGSKTAIGSLWPVDDVASAVVAILYYHYLAKGYIKAEALFAARQDLLRRRLRLEGSSLYGPSGLLLLTGLTVDQQATVRQLHMPFHWAGMTMIGSPW